MPQLMITCPRTHRPLPTNRSLAAAGYAAAAIGPATSGPCPHCGERHAWTKADAYLAGEAPKPAPGTARGGGQA